VSSKKSNHLGKAGHLACMSEWLLLGYNVAIPEVDVGDDVFVVDDLTGKLWRVQVKTSDSRPNKKGQISTLYKLDRDEVMTEKAVDTTYVFALRREQRWEFVVMSRGNLETLRLGFEKKRPAARKEKKFGLTLLFEKDLSDITCWGASFLPYLNNFTRDFPALTQGPGASPSKRTRKKATKP
jgi:hypothetical protein